MSTITTSRSIEISRDDLRAVELESIGYPPPAHNPRSLQRGKDPPPIERFEENITTEPDSGIPPISKWRAALIIGTIACISLIGSMLGGILVVGLPTMARDLGLPNALLLWPASVSALACGCTLLISGSIADVVGGRKIYLGGAFMLTLTTIACGLARTGLELILFRAAQGLAMSLCLPSSVILITGNIPTGSYRNAAFACIGAGQPLGFSLGLILGGLFVESIGWRWGYYIGAMVTFAVFIISIFGIPADPISQAQSFSTISKRLRSDIDWVGCIILSTSLGMFSYVLSVLADRASSFRSPASITLFSVAVILIPVFVLYSRRQERLGRKVIIPPSLWNNQIFTSLCITIFLIWGVFDAIMYFQTLYFQSVQHLSALQTSIRFLPMVVTGAATNFLTGWLVKKVRADILVLGSAAITAVAPLLMAIIKPEWSYWTCAFFATACAPVCADVLFTVANLLITSIFPPKTHGVAGGVFNTISDFGNSFFLALTAIIASSVTMAEKGDQVEALLDGYRATFWLCFGAAISALVVVALGLKKVGKVGIKID